MEELWKDIKNYEGTYQVSNLGRIKNLERAISGRWGVTLISEKILKIAKDTKGYPSISLQHNGFCRKTYKVHRLVWDAFGDRRRDETNLQIDHIDNNKENNAISNLRLVSNRENCSKRSLQKEKSSRFTGVRLDPRKKKPYWTAQIYINDQSRFLGGFNCESLAGLAYQKALISIGEL